jgi:DNA-binding MarR family transcriptional regulator
MTEVIRAKFIYNTFAKVTSMSEVKYQREIDKENKNRILQALYVEEGADWKKLKEITGFADSVLAKHIKQLEKLGLIRTEIDRRDRRKKRYYVNKEGIEQLHEDLLGLWFFTKLYAEIDRRDIEKTIHRIGEFTLCCMLEGEEYLKAYIKALNIFSNIIPDRQLKRVKERLGRKTDIKLREKKFRLTIKIPPWKIKECERAGYRREDITRCLWEKIEFEKRIESIWSPLFKAVLKADVKIENGKIKIK